MVGILHENAAGAGRLAIRHDYYDTGLESFLLTQHSIPLTKLLTDVAADKSCGTPLWQKKKKGLETPAKTCHYFIFY